MGLSILLAGLVLAGVGCKRNDSGQLPTASGEAIQGKAAPVEGFGLLRAYPDDTGDGLALALEFTQPLVGTQDFDQLIQFHDAKGKDDSSWSLSDDGKTLRYPYIEAGKDYTLTISGELLAADGKRLGKPLTQAVFAADLKPAAVSPRRAACCRRARAVACRWCRSMCRKWTWSSCASTKPRCRRSSPSSSAAAAAADGSWTAATATTRRCRNWPSRCTSTASCSPARRTSVR